MSNARKKNYVGEEFGSLSNLLYRHALIWLGTWIPVLSAHMKFLSGSMIRFCSSGAFVKCGSDLPMLP
jgi:hypothetical protein